MHVILYVYISSQNANLALLRVTFRMTSRHGGNPRTSAYSLCFEQPRKSSAYSLCLLALLTRPASETSKRLETPRDVSVALQKTFCYTVRHRRSKSLANGAKFETCPKIFILNIWSWFVE